MTREMGKVLAEARGDVQEAIDMTLLHGRRGAAPVRPDDAVRAAGQVRHVDPRRRSGSSASSRRGTSRSRSRPGRSFPALVCGNTVVFKPADDTPPCAQRFVELLLEAGVPKGVVNVVTAPAREVGAPLVEHPDVRVVSFTGSTRDRASTCSRPRGRAAQAACTSSWAARTRSSSWTTPTSTSPSTASSGRAFGTTGQRCTAASRVIVHRPVDDDVRRAARRAAPSASLGDGLRRDDATSARSINRSALEKIRSYIEIGQGEGATLLMRRRASRPATGSPTACSSSRRSSPT